MFSLDLQLCTPRVMPSSPEDHYRAVCRALATESSELRIFLTKVFTNQTEALRIKADAQSSRQELAKLAFSDWVSCLISDSFWLTQLSDDWLFLKTCARVNIFTAHVTDSLSYRSRFMFNWNNIESVLSAVSKTKVFHFLKAATLLRWKSIETDYS